MNEFQQLTTAVLQFIRDRHWEQYQNPKDHAVSLVLEATEVLEHFQWKSGSKLKKYLKTNKADVADELCDVLYWVLLMAAELKINLPQAFQVKLEKNHQKYPLSPI